MTFYTAKASSGRHWFNWRIGPSCAIRFNFGLWKPLVRHNWELSFWGFAFPGFAFVWDYSKND